jgi:hypothetical protein
MPKKSVTVKTVRKSAAEIPHASPADLDRLRAAMQGPIDTAEIPGRRTGIFSEETVPGMWHPPGTWRHPLLLSAITPTNPRCSNLEFDRNRVGCA